MVWNATYSVRGRPAIFGAYQLWCALNHIEVKINRIGAPPPDHLSNLWRLGPMLKFQAPDGVHIKPAYAGSISDGWLRGPCGD